MTQSNDKTFTPGPWIREPFAHDTPDAFRRAFLISGCGYDVAYIAPLYTNNVPSHEMLSNAALIMAAPELYEALNSLLASCRVYEDSDEFIAAVEIATSALTEARGESCFAPTAAANGDVSP